MVPQRAVAISVDRGNSNVVVGTRIDVNDETKSMAYLAEVEREAARVMKGRQCVRIAGAKAASINGMYKPTDELCGNATVYNKVGDHGKWLEYNADLMQWQLKPTTAKGTAICWANCTVPTKCLPQNCHIGLWQVSDHSATWGPQPAVTISVVSQKEVDAYLAEMERETARVVKGSQHVRIAGATGAKADEINGLYKPTDELSGICQGG